jgi:hypothetical protein
MLLRLWRCAVARQRPEFDGRLRLTSALDQRLGDGDCRLGFGGISVISQAGLGEPVASM